MAYKLTAHEGVISLLVARAAYNGSNSFYEQCGLRLRDLKLTVRTVGKNMELAPPQDLPWGLGRCKLKRVSS